MRRLTISLAAILAAAVAGGSAYADVYKTVDAQGQPHYSDQWSPGAVLIKSDRPHEDLSAAAAPAPAPAPPPADPKQAAAQKAVDADMAAVHADDCKRLQEAYEKEIHARRIIEASSSGPDPQYMSDAEADAERVKTKEAMDEACGATQPAT